MARRPGEISIAEAARRIECHEDTVRNWTLEAFSGNGASKLAGAVRKDATNHYWIAEKRVGELLAAQVPEFA
jgi:hypothetical protein